MRWESVHVAGAGVWLPGPVTARSAVEAGRYDPEQCAADDLIEVRVAPDDMAPPDMAVHAATTALKRSGVDVEDIELLVHASIWFQGVEMWPAASYIAGQALGRHIPAFGLRQECNAGLAALEVAARHVASGPDTAAAVVTTADRFGEPVIQRWSSEPGFVYGDGASALLLSRRGGFARLLSTAAGADNSLEAVVRGAGFVPHPTAEPLDLPGRVEYFIKNTGSFRSATERLAAVVRDVVGRALADADTDMESIARVVVPASGRSRMDWQVDSLLGIPLAKSSWDFARRAGHLGAGDQAAGLNHLVETGQVSPGDKVLLVGGGSGFSCTCAVVEITEAPQWLPQDGTRHTEAP
ncbi:3-oxoacyl-[acyl-carrier-protein] synthase-3 [Streptomyces sp. 840.1]|uniref:ketoacyl-ACP synthase III family protein n=1 Tax=Streptomyces sp. 840.1 TaxID=2485152 RepID=UPI000F46A441|nr:ketoacyl-ACP synthase III family protein [Streptomyces sp. 840.1]ROQ67148.1 3-oxoacyl-[acyl-carrier-protein] synthase-3 [Streptomyces sp. 840.1]